MQTRIELGDLSVEVVLKEIKNIHLSVYPPEGRVRISAPARLSLEAIRVYALSKLDWIKRQQQKIQAQARETPREYLDRESHYLWGRRYLLETVEVNAPPAVELRHSRLLLQVRPGAGAAKKQAVLEAYYRGQLRETIPALIAKWEPILGVQVGEWAIKKMKTRWGTCNPAARRIWLNLELAKKPAACLEYIVVHEMTHLLERQHTARFRALMSEFLPHWQMLREELNRQPLGHVEWEY